MYRYYNIMRSYRLIWRYLRIHISFMAIYGYTYQVVILTLAQAAAINQQLMIQLIQVVFSQGI